VKVGLGKAAPTKAANPKKLSEKLSGHFLGLIVMSY
jgi:hypothetical protein